MRASEGVRFSVTFHDLEDILMYISINVSFPNFEPLAIQSKYPIFPYFQYHGVLRERCIEILNDERYDSAWILYTPYSHSS